MTNVMVLLFSDQWQIIIATETPIMDSPEHPSRLELEKAWQNRVRRAFSQYQKKSGCTSHVVDEWQSVRERGSNPDGVLAIQLARREEFLALAEYMRVVGIYRDLVIHGITPEEASDKDRQ